MSAEISIELVPRTTESLNLDTSLLKDLCPSIKTVNIPDLLRMQIRSWDACAHCQDDGFKAIPHIRAMDFQLEQVATLVNLLASKGLDRILVVRGDAPTDLSHPVYGTTSVDLIRALKVVAPYLKIYAAFDPYRQALQHELQEAAEKLTAGACGFFTQPVFDIRLADLCADLLPSTAVFWGVSPVLSAGSKSYWETRNRAFFPSTFRLDLSWHRAFAREVLEWASSRHASVYFMPIRVDLRSYLEGLVQ